MTFSDVIEKILFWACLLLLVFILGVLIRNKVVDDVFAYPESGVIDTDG
ncbi:MAG: hypothetical protein AAF902_02035 [Chloroflexota bacterium]